MKTSWPKATMMVGSKFLKVYLRYINILTLHYNGEVLMGGSGFYSNLQNIGGKYHFHLHWSYFDSLSMKYWKLEMLTFYKSVCAVKAPVKETMFEEMARKVFFCHLCCGISTYALQEEKREAGKIKSGITRSLRLEIDSSSFLTQLICTTLKYQTNMTSSCHIPSPPNIRPL